jgi:hypothetical protein
MEDGIMDNSDNSRPTSTPTGNVESTPEAGPLTPPTMRDHFATPGAGEQSAAAQAGTSATPEAVVTAASSAGATEQPTATSAGSGAGAGAGGSNASGSSATPGGQPERDPEAIARDLGERLKPVVEAAEDVATKALDLSAKGLTKLVDMLEERRRQRQPADATESNDPSQPTNPS